MNKLLKIVILSLSIMVITYNECKGVSPLPELNSITEITLYNYSYQFEIKFPQSEFVSIYNCFEKTDIDTNPAKWVYGGDELRIQTNDGKRINIDIFIDESGPFAIKKIYYHGLNFKKLNEVINKYKSNKHYPIQ
jgi:hypothetical protein